MPPNRADVAISEPVLSETTARWCSTGAVSRGPRSSAICPCTNRANVSAWTATKSVPSVATTLDARANRKSPTMIATELSYTALALGALRRSSAESITSSW